MDYLKENTPTRPSAASAACVAIVLVGIVCATAKPATAADDYMYCFASADVEKVTYFSAVFLGDYLYDSYRAGRNFRNYLKGAGRNQGHLRSLCFFENTRREAELELQYEALKKQRYLYADWTVVHTRWEPGFSGPLPPGGGGDTPGGENGGDGCYFGECPDGVPPPAQSPNTPPRETSQRTLICSTPEGWCEMSAELPIGQPCGCFGSSGPVGGISVQSSP